MRAGLFDGDEKLALALDPARIAYVFLARGELRVAGVELHAGDAACLEGETVATLDQGTAAEVLVFDLAP